MKPLIGMLTQDEYFDSILPGHTHHPLTYGFEIELKLIKDWEGTFYGWNLEAWTSAAVELEQTGVRAITCNCGKTGVMQEELTRVVKVPVFTSSILQVPVVKRFLSREKKVGIVTSPKAKFIWPKLQSSCGIESDDIKVLHLSGGKEWASQFRSNRSYKFYKVRDQVVKEIVEFVSSGDIGTLVLECTELPLYSDTIQTATKLPVFDAVTMINWVYSSLTSDRGLHDQWKIQLASYDSE